MDTSINSHDLSGPYFHLECVLRIEVLVSHFELHLTLTISVRL